MHHVSHQGQQFGPYTVEQINQYLAQGTLDASSHVWDANANGWVEIRQLPGVALPLQSIPTPTQPHLGKCLITIHRESGFWSDRIRKYKIFIDGKETGDGIMEGDRHEFHVNHGHHEIFLKIDWCTSRKIKFNTNNLSEVQFKCRPGSHPLLALLYITILYSSYIHLEPVTSGISH